jgi:beta-N-acetylhexosaminidase
MNFAPVADLGPGDRTFGEDPATVAGFVDAVVTAQEEAGIIPVVKHWPGAGGAGGGALADPDSLPPLEELRASDLTVFDRAIAAGAPAIMVAHATVEGLTEQDVPASMSRAAITDELRGRQGFDGLVITDSLGTGAAAAISQDDGAVRAITAGADIALVSGVEEVDAAHRAITAAITGGSIPDAQVTASVRRILALKGVTGQCLDLAAAFTALRPDAPGGTADQGVNGSGDGSGSGDGEGDGDGSGVGGGTGTGPGSGTGSGSGSG